MEATIEVEMGEFEEYASIVTNSNLFKIEIPRPGKTRSQVPPAGGILALESTRTFGTSSLFLLPIFGIRRWFLLSFTGRGPSTSRLCRAGHWIQWHGKVILPWKGVVHVAPWIVAVIHRAPASTLDDRTTDARPSDICTYESSLHRPDFEDSLNQGERHTRWMGLLIATRSLTTPAACDSQQSDSSRNVIVSRLKAEYYLLDVHTHVIRVKRNVNNNATITGLTYERVVVWKHTIALLDYLLDALGESPKCGHKGNHKIELEEDKYK